MRRTVSMRVPLAAVVLLACSTQPSRADCVTYLLRDRLKHPDVHLVLSGKVTQIRDVLSDPAVQHVTLLVDRVWKGNVNLKCEVYNIPAAWHKVRGMPRGYRPFELDQSYVVVARRLTSLERSELGVGAEVEGYGTAYCRDGSRTLAEAEINDEFAHIGAGRKVQ